MVMFIEISYASLHTFRKSCGVHNALKTLFRLDQFFFGILAFVLVTCLQKGYSCFLFFNNIVMFSDASVEGTKFCI